MMHLVMAVLSVALVLACTGATAAEAKFKTDRIPAAGGDIEITFIGHGTLMFTYAGKTVHVDPWARLADYSTLPKADLILITHEHHDHLDPKAVRTASRDGTIVLMAQVCATQLKGGGVMKNGDVKTAAGLTIEAVPAYNIVHQRPDGEPFHPKGVGNGYVITFGDTRIYVAGDTEHVPEMKALGNIAVAFLPMNLPYTMTPEMVAEAAKAFMPKILYPYHTGDTDVSRLPRLLKDTPEIEVRIRSME